MEPLKGTSIERIIFYYYHIDIFIILQLIYNIFLLETIFNTSG